MRRGRHEGAGVAVLDDVGHLLGGEVGVDRRVVEAGALGRPADLEEAGLVLDQEGDVVTEAEAGVLPHPGQPAGALLQLGVGDDLARAGHDDRRVVGTLLGMDSGPHGPNRRCPPDATRPAPEGPAESC